MNPTGDAANNPEGRVDQATFAGWVDAYWPVIEKESLSYVHRE